MTRALAAVVGLVLFAAGESKLLRPPRRNRREPVHRRLPWRAVAVLEMAVGVALVLTPHPVALGMALAFLLAATAWLAIDLATPATEPCNCFGARGRHHRRPDRPAGRLDALLPAWYFVRNGSLVLMAGAGLGWSPDGAAGALGVVWSLLAVGTAAAPWRVTPSRAAPAVPAPAAG